MGIDGVHTANIVTMMYRANGKAVPSMVFDIEDVHREQWSGTCIEEVLVDQELYQT